MRYMTTADMAERNAAAGRFWFSPDTLRFFSGRVAQCGYLTGDGTKAYFVSSEANRHASTAQGRRRLYSVRVFDTATGEVDTFGEFQAYASRSGADRAARRAAEAHCTKDVTP